uniref:Putative tick salivary peptide group 1 n=1 Tax=Ixodes ricinus TaxID=34613 RepID=A0A147BFI3_IXORI
MRAIVLVCALIGLFLVGEVKSACERTPNITSCDFYCRKANGEWEHDYLPDGELCNYLSEKDGRCKGGSCYLIESDAPSPVDDVVTEVPNSKKKKSSKTKGTQSKNKKTKKSKQSKDAKTEKKKKSKKVESHKSLISVAGLP